MTQGSTILQAFPGFIGVAIAGGVLALAFNVAGGIEILKERKPSCVEAREPGATMPTYNPDCHPKRK